VCCILSLLLFWLLKLLLNISVLGRACAHGRAAHFTQSASAPQSPIAVPMAGSRGSGQTVGASDGCAEAEAALRAEVCDGTPSTPTHAGVPAAPRRTLDGVGAPKAAEAAGVGSGRCRRSSRTDEWWERVARTVLEEAMDARAAQLLLETTRAALNMRLVTTFATPTLALAVGLRRSSSSSGSVRAALGVAAEAEAEAASAMLRDTVYPQLAWSCHTHGLLERAAIDAALVDAVARLLCTSGADEGAS
jgi:hypothetical protein